MNKERGFIALTSVLIIMAVIMVLGITAFHSSLTDQAISVSFDNGLEASTLAHACAQAGLSILKDDINYSQGYGYLDLNKEEILIDGIACDALEIEDVNSYTKRVSSLVLVGERPNFKRAQAELKYLIQSNSSDWQNWTTDNVEIVNNSLVLEPGEEVIKQRTTNTGAGWLNSFEMTDLAVNGNDLTLLETEGVFASQGTRISNPYSLSEIVFYESSEIVWVNDKPEGTDIKIYTAVNNNPSAIPVNWLEATSGNSIPGINIGDNLSDKFLWTKIELSTTNTSLTPLLHSLTETISMTGSSFGEAESISFDIFDNDSREIKNAKIFWQSQEGTDSQIVFEINVYNGSEWLGWEQVKNGNNLLNLENEIMRDDMEIKLKAIFSGNRSSYPSLNEVKIFIEL